VELGLEKYSDGIASIEQALLLVPDHSRALVELGNMYLFSLQHYKRALDCFDRTLRSDPQNVQALFGKGVVLHYLGEHSESQVVLDRLLAERSARWSTVPADFHDYYRGQGYHYRAYNYYVMGFPVESRKWVDFARRFRPDAEGPNYLSGVLRFDEGDIASAQGDFHKVVDSGTDLCDAYYRLGQIAFREKTRDTLSYFMNNGYCLEQNVQAVEERLKRVPTLDLDQATKDELHLAITDALKERREAAIASIFSMMNTVRSTDRFDSEVFLQSMEELMDQVSR
jgi:tetratricopeptide (TPR) repeat protein